MRVTDQEIAGLWARLSSRHVGGATSPGDEVTGDFGNKLEAISIGDDGWFRLLAEN